MTEEDLIKTSQDLLSAAKSDGYTNDFRRILSALDLSTITVKDWDCFSKVFWINIYNSFSIISLRANRAVLKHPIRRVWHFKRRKIKIGEVRLSLDDIDHGMLRKSKSFFCKGYLKKIYVSSFEKKFRVKYFDPRIHFALNCGALSCPPIRFYTTEKLNEELDLATESFLIQEAIYDHQKNILYTSKIFNWYVGDFGGRNGVIDFHSKYNIIPPGVIPEIAFKKYLWI